MNKNGKTGLELIEKIRSGDQAAFKIFFDEYHKTVFRLCTRMLRDPQEAEDATQEVFLKVFLKTEKFRGESKVSTWLHRIAVNLCLNRLRRNKYARFFSLDFLLEKGNQPAQEPGKRPLAQLSRAEDKTIVDQAIDSLPKNQRIAVILNHFMDFSYKEVSETMGLSAASVRSLLFRAKKNLQKKLKKPR